MSRMNYQRAAAITRQARSHAQHKREQSYKRMDGALASEPQPILKRWLNVPYSDREAAKRVGCRWDPQAKCWWCKLATPEELIHRWL